MGGWTLPGGRVEKGEDILTAAVREAKEESGLDVEVVRPLAVGATAVVSPSAGSVESFDVVFEARVVGGALGPADPTEILDVRWASREDFDALIAVHGLENAHPFDHSMVRSIRGFFEHRASSRLREV